MAGTFRPVWRLTSPTGETHYGLGMTAQSALASMGVACNSADGYNGWSAEEMLVRDCSAVIRFQGRAAVAEFERLGGFAQHTSSNDAQTPAPRLQTPHWIETVYFGIGEVQEVRTHLRTPEELQRWIQEDDVAELWLDVPVVHWTASHPAGTDPNCDEEY